MSSPLVKRFYKAATIEETGTEYAVALDGRIAKTVGKNALQTPSRPLGEAIVEEWAGQGEHIDLATMPFTRLQGFALDGGDTGRAEWRDTVCQYVRTDLLCYRAEDPVLAERQAATWQPVLDQVGGALGCDFLTTASIISVEQPEKLLAAFDASIARLSGAETLALRLITEITGSAVLGWAILNDVVPPNAALEMSRLDEAYQAEKWGIDEEAAAREVKIAEEFAAVVKFLRLTSR